MYNFDRLRAHGTTSKVFSFSLRVELLTCRLWISEVLASLLSRCVFALCSLAWSSLRRILFSSWHAASSRRACSNTLCTSAFHVALFCFRNVVVNACFQQHAVSWLQHASRRNAKHRTQDDGGVAANISCCISSALFAVVADNCRANCRISPCSASSLERLSWPIFSFTKRSLSFLPVSSWSSWRLCAAQRWQHM